MKTFLTSASLMILTAPMALAQQDPSCPFPPCGGSTNKSFVVPEISALEGTAALAALAAIVLLAWERRRRAA